MNQVRIPSPDNQFACFNDQFCLATVCFWMIPDLDAGENGGEEPKLICGHV